jgi:hypothetical protein
LTVSKRKDEAMTDDGPEPGARRARLPREDLRYYGLSWLAAMVLVISGLLAFARGGMALGIAQIALGVVVGPATLSLIGRGPGRD